MTTIDTRAYDDGGRLISSSYNNGVGETRSYNSDNTLASINYSGAAIGDLSYGWDANKNKTSESIGGVMSGYGFSASYDAEDRLTSWNRSDTNLDQSWNLSPVGNWNSITENASVQNRTHGPVHELLTAANQSVEHDAKGNMTLIPPVLRPGSSPLNLKWDFENKLRAADKDNDGIDDVFYRWDALGRRVGRDDGTSNVVYFQDGQQTIADYPSGTATGSPIYTYVYASYIDEPVLRMDSSGAKLYYHRNQQYSITAVSDGGGAVVERYAYTAYGQVTFADASGTVQTASASNNRYTYTGREWDDGLSLYHYRARMYDPISGRFSSRDPIGYYDGPSRYQYVHGNPSRFVDPIGLCANETIVEGPNAMAVSWLEDTRGQDTMIDLASNPRPPRRILDGPFAPWWYGGPSLNSFIRQKEYRNIHILKPRIQCCCGDFNGVTHWGDRQIVGYTPQPFSRPFGGIYIQGVSGEDYKASYTSADNKCVTLVSKKRFQVNWFENWGAAVIGGRWSRFGYAWNKITMRLCCDGSASVSFTGSSIPSYSGYVNNAIQDEYSMIDDLEENLDELYVGPDGDGREREWEWAR